MSDANARFHHMPFHGGGWSAVFRKKLSDHWSVQTGLGFYVLGFENAIANDYSLLNPRDHFAGVRSERPVFRVPATAIYNSNLSCRNWRWFAGAGLSLISGKQADAASSETETDATGVTAGTPNSITQTMHSSPFGAVNFHLVGGWEKLMKSGRMLALGFMFNKGTSQLAAADVSYTIDSKTYSHSFTNYGDFCSLFVTYYFKPFGSRKN